MKLSAINWQHVTITDLSMMTIDLYLADSARCHDPPHVWVVPLLQTSLRSHEGLTSLLEYSSLTMVVRIITYLPTFREARVVDL